MISAGVGGGIACGVSVVGVWECKFSIGIEENSGNLNALRKDAWKEYDAYGYLFAKSEHYHDYSLRAHSCSP